MLLQEAVSQTGVEVYEYLDDQATIPAVSTAACQGDVSILRVTTKPAVTPLPAAGVVVMQAESGGHTHSLHGPVLWDPAVREALVLGTLTVPADTEALLIHPEHGALLIQPGTYRIGGQREWRGEWARVAD